MFVKLLSDSNTISYTTQKYSSRIFYVEIGRSQRKFSCRKSSSPQWFVMSKQDGPLATPRVQDECMDSW